MAEFEFKVHGPFEVSVPVKGKGAEFWKSTAVLEGLAKRVGCYVLALKSRKGKLIPHYVGLTRASFRNEVFNPSNRTKYFRALEAGGTARPVLFLIVPARGKRKGNRRYIREVESFFIGAALARNPNLQNRKGVLRPNWRVPGVVGKARGKATAGARKLRKAMGFSSQS